MLSIRNKTDIKLRTNGSYFSKLMRNEPSILFFNETDYVFCSKRTIRGTKFVELSQETFSNYVLFIPSLCLLKHEVYAPLIFEMKGTEFDQLI